MGSDENTSRSDDDHNEPKLCTRTPYLILLVSSGFVSIFLVPMWPK